MCAARSSCGASPSCPSGGNANRSRGVAATCGRSTASTRHAGECSNQCSVADGPIVAIGGASARNHPSVKGAPALRVVSWIGYGLTIADAGLLIGLSYDNKIDNGQILSVGLLGALSTLGFAIDAGASARQTAALQPQRVSGARFDFSPIPKLGFAVTGPGQKVPMLSWSGKF